MSTVTAPVPFYFPPASGRYEVNPGFYRLGHDFGNGRADTRVFQLDRQFVEYHAAKLKAREENTAKYLCFANYSGHQDRAINQFILRQLCHEHPAYFRLHIEPDRQHLDCRLTGESLLFTAKGDYIECRPQTARFPTDYYVNGFDALAMQIQEDLALITVSQDTNCLTAVHLCFPNHWDPRDKIGADFTVIHHPVPKMAKINSSSDKLLKAALNQQSLLRFAWGISSDKRLNHHPVPPSGVSADQWRGRSFDRDHPAAWLRVERQTLSGLPSINSILFTIRTYHYPLSRLKEDHRNQLARAIRSMSDPTLEYKGLGRDRDTLLAWLEQTGNIL